LPSLARSSRCRFRRARELVRNRERGASRPSSAWLPRSGSEPASWGPVRGWHGPQSRSSGFLLLTPAPERRAVTSDSLPGGRRLELHFGRHQGEVNPTAWKAAFSTAGAMFRLWLSTGQRPSSRLSGRAAYPPVPSLPKPRRIRSGPAAQACDLGKSTAVEIRTVLATSSRPGARLTPRSASP